MQSHIYDFDRKDLFRLLGPPLVPVAIFAVAMHLMNGLHMLPKPRPTLDVDRTILIHQIEASRTHSDAEIVLLGDSSCLIDVSARQLTSMIGQPVLNLATFSYLDLNAHAALLTNFLAANPTRLKAVVLLMHPQSLRTYGASPEYTNFLSRFLAGDDCFEARSLRDQVLQCCGVEIFRERIFCGAVPTALTGPYARRFGFSSDLDRFLTETRGSAIDPERKGFTGRPDYWLSPQLQSASRAFRGTVPRSVKLVVGITPLPARFAGVRYPETYRALLNQWSQWLQPDIALTNLPPTLPDHLFNSTTHLNESGAKEYTAALALEFGRNRDDAQATAKTGSSPF